MAAPVRRIGWRAGQIDPLRTGTQFSPIHGLRANRQPGQPARLAIRTNSDQRTRGIDALPGFLQKSFDQTFVRDQPCLNQQKRAAARRISTARFAYFDCAKPQQLPTLPFCHGDPRNFQPGRRKSTRRRKNDRTKRRVCSAPSNLFPHSLWIVQCHGPPVVTIVKPAERRTAYLGVIR